MQFLVKTRKRILINITSLIDVLFLLLIFFIVSSTFLEQPGMKLDLPKTQKLSAMRMEGHTLFVSADSLIFLNDEAIDYDLLPMRLEGIADETNEKGLILKADENVSYGLVIHMMDIAKQSGISKLIVATKPKDF